MTVEIQPLNPAILPEATGNYTHGATSLPCSPRRGWLLEIEAIAVD